MFFKSGTAPTHIIPIINSAATRLNHILSNTSWLSFASLSFRISILQKQTLAAGTVEGDAIL